VSLPAQTPSADTERTNSLIRRITPREVSLYTEPADIGATGAGQPGVLEIDAQVSGASHQLRLSGELDMQGAPRLETIVHHRVLEASTITLDLGELSFIDSVGLRAILACEQHCRRSACGFALKPGPAQVQDLFELTGLLDRLPFVERR
jgi:anti-sigma B factor antagonist